MTGKERRLREKDETKHAIMETVRQFINEGNWESVTIRKIAEKIEYSPPTIYEHFESKDAILVELKKEALTGLLTAYQKVAAETVDRNELMVKLALAYYDFCMENRGYAKALLGQDGVPLHSDLSIPEWQAMHAFLLEKMAFTLGVQDTTTRVIQDSLEVIRAFVRGIVLATMCNDITPQPEKPKELLKLGVRFLLFGCRSQLQSVV